MSAPASHHWPALVCRQRRVSYDLAARAASGEMRVQVRRDLVMALQRSGGRPLRTSCASADPATLPPRRARHPSGTKDGNQIAEMAGRHLSWPSSQVSPGLRGTPSKKGPQQYRGDLATIPDRWGPGMPRALRRRQGALTNRQGCCSRLKAPCPTIASLRAKARDCGGGSYARVNVLVFQGLVPARLSLARMRLFARRGAGLDH
jgi:hypothetical protein